MNTNSAEEERNLLSEAEKNYSKVLKGCFVKHSWAVCFTGQFCHRDVVG